MQKASINVTVTDDATGIEDAVTANGVEANDVCC